MGYPAFSDFFQKLLFVLPLTRDSFNYDNPHQWYTEFPQCLGLKQSPIAIYSYKSIPVHLPPVIFAYYGAFFSDAVHLHNNGHTVEFSVPETVAGLKPFITGGWLDGTYEADSVHFHWGSKYQKGAEHLINGLHYDLEMHVVHKNHKYPNVELARNFEDGLSVLAVFFKADKKSPAQFYSGLKPIYDHLQKLIEFNSSAEANIMTLESVMVDLNKDNFFTYEGSLTTPPCSESVKWIVFPDPLPIPHSELPNFWKILDERHLTVRNNFRPLQPIAYRNIFQRKTTTDYGLYL